MKKVFFLIILTNLLIIPLITDNLVYASPFYTPSFRFLSTKQLRLGVKEIYTRENDFGLGNVTWHSEAVTDLNYGINKDLELDLSFPYATGGTNKQSGLKDNLIFLKYRIFSNKDYFLAGEDLDIAMQLGSRLRAGEVKKGLSESDTEIFYSLLGRYEIVSRNNNEYFFYFNLGIWFPVEGYYKYENIFQYDIAVEYKNSKKFSIVLEGNGNRTSDYNLFYIAPGFQFRPGQDWEINFSIGGSISDKGGFLNTRSLIELAHIF